MYDILTTGNYSVDLIFTGLPHLPELGREVVGTGFDMIPGEGYTSAVAFHRLGLKVGWAADFGNDDFSLFALKRARSEGLDETFFVHHNRPMRRISVAASFPDDRSFITYYDPDPPIPAITKALATALAKVLFIPGLFFGALFDAGSKIAHLKGVKIIMDGNGDLPHTLEDAAVRRAVKSVEVFLPNTREARRLTGKSDLPEALKMMADLCPLVVIKDGPNGSYACCQGQVFHAAAIPVTPVDTTGAGDCFNAGFIKAWLDGRPIEQCLRWGNIAGGLSTLARGATGRVITAQDIENY